MVNSRYAIMKAVHHGLSVKQIVNEHMQSLALLFHPMAATRSKSFLQIEEVEVVVKS